MTYLLSIRKNIWLIICVMLINSSKISVTYSHKSSPTVPPEIWLSSYQDADSFQNTVAEPEFRILDHFQNQFISKFNKTDYLFTEDTDTVFFTCQAKYPVKWSFPHLKQIEKLQFYLLETSTSRLSNFDQADNPAPTNELYQTIVLIPLSVLADINNANLTCEMVHTKQLGMRKNELQAGHSSSIYIFYAGNSVIKNQGSTIEVQVSISKKQDVTSEIVLPCKPATPAVPILLEKLMDNTNNSKRKWKRLNYPAQYLNLDPKVGFIIKKDIMDEFNIFGLYRCTALEEGDDVNDVDTSQWDDENCRRKFVYVNVTSTNEPKIETEDIKFESTNDLKGDATIAYNHEIFGKQTNVSPNQSIEDSEFICCSGVDNMAPSIYAEFCLDYLQCDILKSTMTTNLRGNVSLYSDRFWAHDSDTIENHSDCVKTLFLFSPVIFCKGENVEFTDHFVNVFSNGLIPVANRFKRKSNETLRLSIYEPETRNFKISRRIFLTIGYPITSKEMDEEDSDEYQRNSFLELITSKDTYDIDYDLINKNKIIEYPRDHFYVGEALIPICLGWSSFYSYGAYLGINYRNGTRKIINLKEGPVVTEVYFSGGLQTPNLYYDGKQIVHKIGWQIFANKDMVSFECWMPQWDTKDWDKISRNLTILESVPPSFENIMDVDNEECVYFYLGEEGKELVWTVRSGAPEGSIAVTKDGKDILKRLKHFQKNLKDDKLIYTFKSLFNVTLEKDNETKIIVRINFNGKITHEMQGVYQCTADNIGGSVRWRFRVIVEGKPNVLVYILLVTTMLSSIFLIGLGSRHCQQRRQVVYLRKNQTSVRIERNY